MDLARLPNEEKLRLCKWYFKVGCLILPFVWAVNAIWFFREAFLKPPFDQQKEIRKYVMWSGCGAIAYLVLFVSWIVTFQLLRVSWGPTGDALSFIIPYGRA